MSLLSESLTIGLLLTLVFGALFFYVYSRVTYVEKRVGLMESLLIDIKMKEEQHHMHLPRVPPSMTFNDTVFNNSEVETLEVQQLPSENVGAVGAVGAVEVVESEAPEAPIEELYSEVLNNDTVPELKTTETASVSVGVNYEAMTKDELIDIAKRKGINVGNRPGREKVLKLIHQSEGLNNTE